MSVEKGSKGNQQELNKKSGPRNSEWRDPTEKYFNIGARGLHRISPSTEATDVTNFCLAGIIAASILASKAERRWVKNLALGTLVLFELGDGFDGALARLIEAEQKKEKAREASEQAVSTDQPADTAINENVGELSEDTEEIVINQGQIDDFRADRYGELSKALSRFFSASKRKSKLGQTLALIAAASNPAPGSARAYAESLREKEDKRLAITARLSKILRRKTDSQREEKKGKPAGREVPETGTNIIELAGTKLGRTIISILTTTNPRIAGVPVQEIGDVITIIANLITTWERLRIARDPNYPEEKKLGEQKVREAEARLNEMKKIATVVALAELGAYYLDKWKQSKDKKKKHNSEVTVFLGENK